MLVFFMAILLTYFAAKRYILRRFGTFCCHSVFSTRFVSCTEKNLATLMYLESSSRGSRAWPSAAETADSEIGPTGPREQLKGGGGRSEEIFLEKTHISRAREQCDRKGW
jgi:hypothetical protein